MLQVSRVSKSYGVQTDLEDVSFVVNRGDRAGLFGPNGYGKSTLLRVIAGQERSDSGHVSLDPSATLGHLPQGLELDSGRTIVEEIRSGIKGREATRREVEWLTAQMAGAKGRDLEQLLEDYSTTSACFMALGGYEFEHRVATVLQGMGLGVIDPDTPVNRLSGGERSRLGLARLLLAEPSVLILDEPTNHLDTHALEWLERFLSRYQGS